MEGGMAPVAWEKLINRNQSNRRVGVGNVGTPGSDFEALNSVPLNVWKRRRGGETWKKNLNDKDKNTDFQL